MGNEWSFLSSIMKSLFVTPSRPSPLLRMFCWSSSTEDPSSLNALSLCGSYQLKKKKETNFKNFPGGMPLETRRRDGVHSRLNQLWIWYFKMLPKTAETVLPHLRVRENKQTQSIKHKNCNLGLIEFVAKPYPAMKERTELEESNSKSILVEDFSVLKLSSRYSIRGHWTKFNVDKRTSC